MSSAGFEPAIPAGERLQIDALDRSATGTGFSLLIIILQMLHNHSSVILWRGSVPSTGRSYNRYGLIPLQDNKTKKKEQPRKPDCKITSYERDNSC